MIRKNYRTYENSEYICTDLIFETLISDVPGNRYRTCETVGDRR